MSNFLSRLFLSILFLMPLSCTAQFENDVLKTPIVLTDTNVNTLMLHWWNLGFLRNTEFFNPHIVGGTFFGYQLAPELTYQPSKYVKISGGVYLHKDFGNPNYTFIAPLFSMKLQNNGYGLIFGNIEGRLNHNMDEPIFNIERQIHNLPENGAQVLVNKKYFKGDLFINWLHMIYQSDTFQPISSSQEQIMAGMSNEAYIIHQPNITISIPFQALLYHHGGQFNVIPKPVQTLGNFSEGLNIGINTSSKVFSKIRFSTMYMQYRHMSGDTLQPFNSGTGSWTNLLVQSKSGVGIVLTYWYGHQWEAPLGNYLFSSLSIAKKNYMTDDRRLIFVRLLYTNEILPGMKMDIRMEPYYDLRAHQLEYSYSFYLSFTRDFTLIKKVLH